MAKDSHHVVTNPNGGWSVKKEGSDRAMKRFESLDSAIDYGRKVSQDTSSDLYIHKRDGTIQSRDIYRNTSLSRG